MGFAPNQLFTEQYKDKITGHAYHRKESLFPIAIGRLILDNYKF